MVRQMRKEYRVKDESLKSLWAQAQAIVDRFDSVEFTHVPRTDPDIVRANRLANQALDSSV